MKRGIIEMLLMPQGKMTQADIEYYHNHGKMPDWIYYQLSDKPDWMKLEEQREKIYRELAEREALKKAEKEKAQQEKEIEKQVNEQIEKALDDLFKDFHF